MGHPSAGPGGPAASAWAPPPPRRSRAPFWIAVACVISLLAVGFLAVTGGVIHLAVRSAGGDEETSGTEARATIEHEHFTFSHPSAWTDRGGDEGDPDSDIVAEVVHEGGDPEVHGGPVIDAVTVYAFDSDLHAEASCRSQAMWIGFGWDDSQDPEELDPVTVGGRELPAHRALGTHDGQDVVGEMYCADAGEDVVQIVVESYGATELSPGIREVLESWTWAEEQD